MGAIFTIGYEGASVRDLIVTLERAGVQHVMDVRELPQSRRPGFSKNVLAQALAEAGIGYSHVKQLGDPKEGREAARRGDFEEFKAIFSAHLDLPETRAALTQAAGTVARQTTVLLCYERDPKTCHRSLVAKRLQDVCSLSVQHLGVVHNAERHYGTVARAA
jgi:uncharacterized protein (DUF488 family)